jgi:hypothetical protein
LNDRLRRQLFTAPLSQLFPIDAVHTDWLPRWVAGEIRRYRLQYTVCRVAVAPQLFADLGFDGCVWLRFQARAYPDIVTYSANNPTNI